MEVRLDNEEWQRVLAVLAQGAWAQVNPLIMKIADQLRAQAQQGAQGGRSDGAGPDPTSTSAH